MRRDFKWGGRALVMAVLTMAVSLSERAQAQQTGLFPLSTIRRERPPCPNEDPVYKYYKQRYFGYHPTCWSPFPAGWGCPSKETVDKEKEFKERPLGQAAGDGGGRAGVRRQPGPAAAQAWLQPNRPTARDAAGSGSVRDRRRAGGDASGWRSSPANDASSGGRRSPFETIPQGASLSPSRRSTRARTVPPGQAVDAPELSAPMGQPEQDAAARSTRGDADDETVARGDNGPLLAVEDLDAPRPGKFRAAPSSIPSRSSRPSRLPPRIRISQPAPRRGLISNLFGGLGLNWLRR